MAQNKYLDFIKCQIEIQKLYQKVFLSKIYPDMKSQQLLQNSPHIHKLPSLTKTNFNRSKVFDESFQKFCSKDNGKIYQAKNYTNFINQFPQSVFKQKKLTSKTLQPIQLSFQKQYYAQFERQKIKSHKKEKNLTEQIKQNQTEDDNSYIQLNNKILNPENEDYSIFNFGDQNEKSKLISIPQKKNNKHLSILSKNLSLLTNKKRIKSQISLNISQKNLKNITVTHKDTNNSLNNCQKSMMRHKSYDIHQKKRGKYNIQVEKHKTPNMQLESQKTIKKIKDSNRLNIENIFKIKTNCELKIGNQQVYFSRLLKNLHKFKSDKKISDLDNLQLAVQQDQVSSKNILKRQINSRKWNRVQISPSGKVTCRDSSFDEELKKISQYTRRNSLSMEKYLKIRKQMFKYNLK